MLDNTHLFSILSIRSDNNSYSHLIPSRVIYARPPYDRFVLLILLLLSFKQFVLSFRSEFEIQVGNNDGPPSLPRARKSCRFSLTTSPSTSHDKPSGVRLTCNICYSRNWLKTGIGEWKVNPETLLVHSRPYVICINRPPPPPPSTASVSYPTSRRLRACDPCGRPRKFILRPSPPPPLPSFPRRATLENYLARRNETTTSAGC